MFLLWLVLLAFCRLLVSGELLRHRDKRNAMINAVYDDTWSQWGPCTAQCGGGTQERTLGCRVANSQYNKACMTTTATCNLMPCNDVFQWSEWGRCSAKCRPDPKTPTGVRSRYSKLQNGQQQTIHCNVQSCTKIAGCGKADLLFVLDSSASVGELNWYRTKQFVLDVISGLAIGANDTRVGVVVFSTEVSVQLHLGQHGRLDELRQTIWSMPYMAGSTNTADALRVIRNMAAQYGRQEVKAVAVVITDGESNILPETTTREADLCRNDTITIFAIGVGSVNHGEVKGIANKPSEVFYHFVEDYEALHSIVTTVVADTCETANQVFCSDWSQWSQCSVSCGDGGTQTRSRDCRIVDYYGKVLRTFSRDEKRSCRGGSCLVTELPVTGVTRPISTDTSGVDCSLCDFHDNTGYLQDRSDCSRYIECVKRPDGGYWVYRRSCPPTMFWNQALLTCDRTPYLTGCVVLPPAPTTTVAPSYVNVTSDCPFRRDEAEPWRFYIEFGGRKLYQQCLPNMQFDQRLCVCLGFPTAPACDHDLLLDFPFDNDFNDVSCNKAKPDIYGHPLLTTDVQRKENVAYFNGTSRLTVGFLYNWFAGHRVDQWSISVWFKPDGHVTDAAGIVNNGDCKQGPSFALSVGRNDVILGEITTDRGRVTLNKQMVTGKWQHVALVYSGDALSLYVDGQKSTRSLNQHGFVANRQCPMNIAHRGVSSKSGYFHGYLDELKIYSRALVENEVQELFQDQ